MPGHDIIQGALDRRGAFDHGAALDRVLPAHGHEYHLYTYGSVANIPPGTRLRDAREVLPESLIFRYTKHPSYAGFANYFRYRLLLDGGGWWVDIDAVCLRPFDFSEDYVFGSEPDGARRGDADQRLHQGPGRQRGDGLRLGALPEQRPRPAHLGRDRASTCGRGHPEVRTWPIPPRSPDFRPYPPFRLGTGPRTGVGRRLPRRDAQVHLWNEMWRRGGRDKDASYPPDCLYERLKARYL